ncbi:PREDICTED: Retrovirus-related Pol poly from transposon [Prunus dulcis]|uniref:PREDICTED: Retrovirus-related Pol poly from transposon n=1 Tax=Prunus dulcis TaxID=3755 RepID=A0A5E4GA28_PRUDU|nr:PREDICTED: Retrovirus-related Pol poly from transposon [Prunus dulcis]
MAKDFLEYYEVEPNRRVAVLSKCTFGQSSIDYLDHTIFVAGVAVDTTKVQCIQAWPKPTTVKGLRGFLGLAGYYRKFVQNFGLIARPLTDLLKKDSFLWTPIADHAFAALKEALTTTPFLASSDFDKPFTVECDASNGGLGAVL